MSQSISGIDFAKHSFNIYGEDEHGKMLLNKTMTRAKILAIFNIIPPAIIGM